MTGERIQQRILGAAFLANQNDSGQNDDQTGQLSHDRYEVYLNNEFVGYKTLLVQGDTLSDVDDFLKQQGVQQFSTKVDGDHYYVDTDDAMLAKDVLTVYCQNR